MKGGELCLAVSTTGKLFFDVCPVLETQSGEGCESPQAFSFPSSSSLPFPVRTEGQAVEQGSDVTLKPACKL